MKTNRAILIVVVLAAFVADEGHADLNGSDDFNGSIKDTNKWGIDLTNGVGRLTQTNGHLEYTTTGVPTTFDLAALPWKLNFGSYTQNWEVQADVNVPILTLSTNQSVEF